MRRNRFEEDDFEYDNVEDEALHLKEKSRRASRRHQKNRMKNKAKNKYKEMYSFEENAEVLEEQAIKNADHLANCSCPMCGNPRRHFKKPTIQERIAEEKFREEIKEIE